MQQPEILPPDDKDEVFPYPPPPFPNRTVPTAELTKALRRLSPQARRCYAWGHDLLHKLILSLDHGNLSDALKAHPTLSPLHDLVLKQLDIAKTTVTVLQQDARRFEEKENELQQIFDLMDILGNSSLNDECPLRNTSYLQLIALAALFDCELAFIHDKYINSNLQGDTDLAIMMADNIVGIGMLLPNEVKDREEKEKAENEDDKEEAPNDDDVLRLIEHLATTFTNACQNKEQRLLIGISLFAVISTSLEIARQQKARNSLQKHLNTSSEAVEALADYLNLVNSFFYLAFPDLLAQEVLREAIANFLTTPPDENEARLTTALKDVLHRMEVESKKDAEAFRNILSNLAIWLAELCSWEKHEVIKVLAKLVGERCVKEQLFILIPTRAAFINFFEQSLEK